MIQFPAIDPVAFTLGPVAVHWYGLAYIAGIGIGWWVLGRRAASRGWTPDAVADLVFYAALGAVLGGRIGYMVFYNFADFVAAPWSVLAVWRGGMSFHGGLLGMVVALTWFGRRRGRGFFACADFVVPVVPIGLGLGRVANFVNQELWGAPTTLPWGVLFTHPAAAGVARHPTQLYEALLEGVVLYVILAALDRRQRPAGHLLAWCLIFYAVFRIAVEFVREPDQHIGYLAWGWLTMGQVLSAPVLVAGLLILCLKREVAGSKPAVEQA